MDWKRTCPAGVAVRTENYEWGIFDPPPDFAKLAEAANCYGETVFMVQSSRGFKTFKTFKSFTRLTARLD